MANKAGKIAELEALIANPEIPEEHKATAREALEKLKAEPAPAAAPEKKPEAAPAEKPHAEKKPRKKHGIKKAKKKAGHKKAEAAKPKERIKNKKHKKGKAYQERKARMEKEGRIKGRKHKKGKAFSERKERLKKEGKLKPRKHAKHHKAARRESSIVDARHLDKEVDAIIKRVETLKPHIAKMEAAAKKELHARVSACAEGFIKEMQEMHAEAGRKIGKKNWAYYVSSKYRRAHK